MHEITINHPTKKTNSTKQNTKQPKQNPTNHDLELEHHVGPDALLRGEDFGGDVDVPVHDAGFEVVVFGVAAPLQLVLLHRLQRET